MNSFYIIKLSNSEEEFYKVGISSATNEDELYYRRLRYIKNDTNYQIEVLEFISCGEYLEVEIFKELILDILDTHKYDPKRSFGGSSECFLEQPIELLKNETLLFFSASKNQILKLIRSIDFEKNTIKDKVEYSIRSAKQNTSFLLNIAKNYHILLLEFQSDIYGLPKVEISSIKNEIRREIFPAISKIEALIKKRINEKLTELKANRNKLIKLESKKYTERDYYEEIFGDWEKILAKGIASDKLVPEKQRLELMESTAALIEAYSDRIELFEENLTELLRDKTEFQALLSDP